ncbi:MAG: hypothetical protein K0S76_51 [Herbinix sp.]|jgi:flagellar protein FlaG|nr:hypothetical protein [Herbinix sp.]
MAVDGISGSSYRDVNPDQKLVNINLAGQIPNVNLTQKPVLETSTNGNQSDSKQNDGKKHNEQKDKAAIENYLKTEINKANNKLKFTRTKCEFKYYEDINRVAIKVIDSDTEEVIREIPPEETLELVQKLWEFAGLLFDEKR